MSCLMPHILRYYAYCNNAYEKRGEYYLTSISSFCSFQFVHRLGVTKAILSRQFMQKGQREERQPIQFLFPRGHLAYTFAKRENRITFSYIFHSFCPFHNFDILFFLNFFLLLLSICIIRIYGRWVVTPFN